LEGPSTSHAVFKKNEKVSEGQVTNLGLSISGRAFGKMTPVRGGGRSVWGETREGGKKPVLVSESTRSEPKKKLKKNARILEGGA